AAQHGSWNREKRTGYKVVRALLQDGVPTGEYEDFMTGFVVNDSSVWARPVGVAVAHDGALLVTEDGNGTAASCLPKAHCSLFSRCRVSSCHAIPFPQPYVPPVSGVPRDG